MSAEQLEILATGVEEVECEICDRINWAGLTPSYQHLLRRIAKDLRKVADDGVEE